MPAGIYIHIPFCKRKCFYCDFYSIANLNHKKDFIDALQKEIVLQKKYLQRNNISTIYFGGGTPSLLTTSEISFILFSIKQNYKVDANAEITIEANPDDIGPEAAKEWLNAGINRISIGVQTFSDADLKLLNRRHSAQQAIHAIAALKQAGFSNISADLIYGLPGMTTETWKKNLNILFSLEIQHISAYHLSVEAGTVFAHFLEKGKIKLVEEDQSWAQFKMLIHEAKQHGFIHYELSNFSLENYESKHNSAYWQQKKYLGLGPSAHSYNGNSRQWNVSDLKQYIVSINENIIPSTVETLSDADKFNDYVMISLRTKSGINIKYLMSHFPVKTCDKLLQKTNKYVASAHLKILANNIILTDEGLFISDKIIADLFI